MPRFEEWPRRLNDAIEAARAQPFIWGQHDCCLFVAGCVDAMTGGNYAAEYKGKYATAEDAAALLESKGGIEAIIGQTLKEVAINFAQRGDVVLLDIDGSPLGIVDLSGMRIAAVGPLGLKFVSIRMAQKAWKVE